jgi:hypothetical protein
MDGAAPPANPLASAEALVARLPEAIGNFRRGGTTALSEPAPGGQEIAYATANRGIAGFVQVIPRTEAVVAESAEDELQRFLRDTLASTAMHRRLRQRATLALPEQQPALRCASLDGTYGRQAVESLACTGSFDGQLVRLRLSYIRRDGRMAEARDFASLLATTLR